MAGGNKKRTAGQAELDDQGGSAANTPGVSDRSKRLDARNRRMAELEGNGANAENEGPASGGARGGRGAAGRGGGAAGRGGGATGRGGRAANPFASSRAGGEGGQSFADILEQMRATVQQTQETAAREIRETVQAVHTSVDGLREIMARQQEQIAALAAAPANVRITVEHANAPAAAPQVAASVENTVQFDNEKEYRSIGDDGHRLEEQWFLPETFKLRLSDYNLTQEEKDKIIKDLSSVTGTSLGYRGRTDENGVKGHYIQAGADLRPFYKVLPINILTRSEGEEYSRDRAATLADFKPRLQPRDPVNPENRLPSPEPVTADEERYYLVTRSGWGGVMSEAAGGKKIKTEAVEFGEEFKKIQGKINEILEVPPDTNLQTFRHLPRIDPDNNFIHPPGTGPLPEVTHMSQLDPVNRTRPSRAELAERARENARRNARGGRGGSSARGR